MVAALFWRKLGLTLFGRLKFVKQRGTKAAQNLPSNFPQLKAGFCLVTAVCQEHQIRLQLVLNMDKTGLSVVQISQWTLEKKQDVSRFP